MLKPSTRGSLCLAHAQWESGARAQHGDTGKGNQIDRGHETPREVSGRRPHPGRGMGGIWVGSFKWFLVLYLNQEDERRMSTHLPTVLPEGSRSDLSILSLSLKPSGAMLSSGDCLGIVGARPVFPAWAMHSGLTVLPRGEVCLHRVLAHQLLFGRHGKCRCLS